MFDCHGVLYGHQTGCAMVASKMKKEPPQGSKKRSLRQKIELTAKNT